MMNHRQSPDEHTPAATTPVWKLELAHAFTKPDALLSYLDIDPHRLPADLTATLGFPMLVPRGFAGLMRAGDPQDPLLRQVLPTTEELFLAPGFGPDPVSDAAAQRAPGLLQKYAGRALLMATAACAVHCRYCFRRHYSLAPEQPMRERINAAVDVLAESTDIQEIILSGGDPLMLDDSALGALIARLEDIPHLRRLRLHTRLPVVLPSRVGQELCRRLTDTRLRPIMVIHANHPAELGDETRRALGALRQAQIPLFNQSVLLRGVNDDADVLIALSERLFELGVVSYYLHQLDRVQGAAHFEVGDACALELVKALRARLPGYLVPRLVREVPGRPCKTQLG